MTNDHNKKFLEVLDEQGLREIDMGKLAEWLKNRRKIQCPVCLQDDVMDDIIAHGPGIAVIGYSCGCEYHVIHEQPPKLVRYDGEVFYENE